MISVLESKSKYDIKKILFKKKTFTIGSEAYFWRTYLKKEHMHTHTHTQKKVETSELRGLCGKKHVLSEIYALLHS